MWLANRRGGASLVTPHLHGGSDREKVEWEYENAREFWQILDGFVSPEEFADKEVVDVGCGWGGKAIYLAETTSLATITCFDLPGVFRPEVADAYARSRGVTRCTFTTGYAEDIPFGDESFDLALMDDVLEHVRDPERVLAECRRVLRPGGLLVARFPSIRMLGAHHFDRALRYPGLHYVMPMRRWAAGFNEYLLNNRQRIRFDPFSEVVDTKYRKGITRDLNGLHLRAVRRIARESGFSVRTLQCVGYPRTAFGRLAPFLYPTYALARAVPGLGEVVSVTLVLLATRPSHPA
jgi:SAM-dependent methyltransferase